MIFKNIIGVFNLYIKIEEQTVFCFLVKVWDEGNSCLNLNLKPTQKGKILKNYIIFKGGNDYLISYLILLEKRSFQPFH